MKKLFLLLVFVCFSFILFAQNQKEVRNNDSTSYKILKSKIETANYLIDAGLSLKREETFLLIGGGCFIVAPFFTKIEIDGTVNINKTYFFMGAGAVFSIFAIVNHYKAADFLIKAGENIKITPLGLSYNF